MIKYTCPNCGNKLDIPDEYAGQKGKCAKCQISIVVPSQDAVEGFIPEPSSISEDSPPTAHVAPKTVAHPPVSALAVSLSVIGFIFGVLALLGSFVPLLGMFALIVAIPAALLAGIGVIVAYVRRAGKAFPVAALTVCLLATGISGYQYVFFKEVGDDLKEHNRGAVERLSGRTISTASEPLTGSQRASASDKISKQEKNPQQEVAPPSNYDRIANLIRENKRHLAYASALDILNEADVSKEQITSIARLLQIEPFMVRRIGDYSNSIVDCVFSDDGRKLYYLQGIGEKELHLSAYDLASESSEEIRKVSNRVSNHHRDDLFMQSNSSGSILFRDTYDYLFIFNPETSKVQKTSFKIGQQFSILRGASALAYVSTEKTSNATLGDASRGSSAVAHIRVRESIGETTSSTFLVGSKKFDHYYPCFSPDSKEFAVVRTARKYRSGYQIPSMISGDLLVGKVDGTDLEPVPNLSQCMHPRFSLDGTRFTVVLERPGRTVLRNRIYKNYDAAVYDRSSASVVFSTSSPLEDTNGRLSPDGRYFAFISNRDAEPNRRSKYDIGILGLYLLDLSSPIDSTSLTSVLRSKESNQRAALDVIRTILAAQFRFKNEDLDKDDISDFAASLDELVNSGLMPNSILTSPYWGYQFKVEGGAFSFIASAEPSIFGETGDVSFSCDQNDTNGQITFRWDGKDSLNRGSYGPKSLL